MVRQIRIVLLISIVSSSLHAQSDMYTQVSNAPYMKWAEEIKCDSTDFARGTTLHELVCLGKEFLALDSVLTDMLKTDSDLVFTKAQESWEIYREQQATIAQREVQNNLGKMDYLNALIITTRNRITTIQSMREGY